MDLVHKEISYLKLLYCRWFDVEEFLDSGDRFDDKIWVQPGGRGGEEIKIGKAWLLYDIVSPCHAILIYIYFFYVNE